MKTLTFAFLALLAAVANAEVAPVAVRVPEPVGWVGQRVPFYIDLRAPGTFSGTASFSLPQVPGALVIRIGEPLVETEEIDGKTWFVQRHEFALFSQKSGAIEIPSFPVRFARREGYSGAATDVEALASGLTFDIRRPPGTEGIGFLVTTEELEVNETWEPAPGQTQVGDVIKRTIVQHAPQMTGIALAPVPEAVIEGVRVYPGEATTHDQLARGAFLGERRETVTYLVQKTGIITLPAIPYVWWDPKSKTLESKTLPAVTLDVAPSLATGPGKPSAADTKLRPWMLALFLVSLLIWQRNRLLNCARRLWKKANPPARSAARRLLRACRRDDPAAANTAWLEWRGTRDLTYQPGPGLRVAIVGLQRRLFGPNPTGTWRGDELARAFRGEQSAQRPRFLRSSESPLPPLNPHL